MKKEIIINASKDRSRIAIVEDGELAELYIEHPDNVRTLGNIYLARIRKIMPVIKAAFVDIGQKQDAFLHFSDLTENLPELLAIAGEPVPGYEAGRALAHAPTKRVADDESEPDVEEQLEFDSGESPPARTRSGGGRARPRGRGGRGRRREEEEEEEERDEERPRPAARRASPFVIDLTLKTGRVATAPVEAPQERPAGDAATAEKPPRRRAASRKRDDERTEPEPAEAAPPAAAPPTAEAEVGTEARADADLASDAATTAGADTASGADAGSETDTESRRRRGRRGGRRRTRAQAESDAAEGTSVSEADLSTEAAAEPEAPTTDPQWTEESDAEAGVAPPKGRRERAPKPAARAAEGRAGRGGRDTTRKRGSAGTEATPASEASPTDAAPQVETRGTPEASETETRRGTPRPSAPRPEKKPEPERKPEAKKATPARSRPSLPDRPEDLLRRDGRILVKITKEPISAKGSRVSTDISLAGRFLVLVPAADYVAVSKKIESARERRRIKTLAESLKPDGFGVIVRTVAEGRDAKTLDTDLRLLLQKWRKIEEQLAEKSEQPQLLYEDVNMVSSIIRDLFTEDYDRILVDDPRLHKNLKAYVQAVAPHMAERVQLHRSNTPVFRTAGLERAVEQVFSTRVPLPSGGYLFIEHTEAMHVVDVNSGRSGRGKSQSENLLAVNLEAAREVAKQLRLRDLGGIIVVDFIDMRSESDRRKVYQALKDAFRSDRAVTKLLPMSDFGLIEITRQRLRPSITAQAQTNGDGAPRDPAAAMAAAGADEIAQPERDFGPEQLDAPTTTDDVVARLDAWLKRYRAEVSEKYRDRPIVVRVHPLLASHLQRGFPSLLTRWRFRLRGVRFALDTDPTLHPLDFEVCDEKSGKSLRSQYDAVPAA